MTATVVVPFQGADPHRVAARDWVVDRLGAAGLEVVVATLDPGQPWCKGRAVASVLDQVTSSSIVVHDADVWCNGLPAALRAAEAGRWAMPHRWVRRLDEAGTQAFWAGADPMACSRVRREYQGFVGGGIVALPTDMYRACPLDPRFEGWGGEDESWGRALGALHGRRWQGDSKLLHFWHPPAAKDAPWGPLRDRYWEARRDRVGMGAIIAEAVAAYDGAAPRGEG